MCLMLMPPSALASAGSTSSPRLEILSGSLTGLYHLSSAVELSGHLSLEAGAGAGAGADALRNRACFDASPCALSAGSHRKKPWGTGSGIHDGTLSAYFLASALSVPGAQPLKSPRGSSQRDLAMRAGSGQVPSTQWIDLPMKMPAIGSGSVSSMRL